MDKKEDFLIYTPEQPIVIKAKRCKRCNETITELETGNMNSLKYCKNCACQVSIEKNRERVRRFRERTINGQTTETAVDLRK